MKTGLICVLPKFPFYRATFPHLPGHFSHLPGHFANFTGQFPRFTRSFCTFYRANTNFTEVLPTHFTGHFPTHLPGHFPRICTMTAGYILHEHLSLFTSCKVYRSTFFKIFESLQLTCVNCSSYYQIKLPR